MSLHMSLLVASQVPSYVPILCHITYSFPCLSFHVPSHVSLPSYVPSYVSSHVQPHVLLLLSPPPPPPPHPYQLALLLYPSWYGSTRHLVAIFNLTTLLCCRRCTGWRKQCVMLSCHTLKYIYITTQRCMLSTFIVCQSHKTRNMSRYELHTHIIICKFYWYRKVASCTEPKWAMSLRRWHMSVLNCITSEHRIIPVDSSHQSISCYCIYANYRAY